jgi:hypothetical protein
VVKDMMNGAFAQSPVGAGKVQIETDFDGGSFVHDGSAIVYRKASGGVFRMKPDGTGKVMLSPTGNVGLRSLSPDGKWMLFYKNQDMGTALIDLYLTDATMAAPAVTLDANTDGDIYGPGFTANSAFALYEQAIDATQSGPMYTVGVAGGMPRKLADAVWIWYVVGQGSVVALNDNFDGNSGEGGVADIEVVDVATGGGLCTVAKKADAGFFHSKDGKTLVYSVPMQGLFSAPVPQP